MVERICPDCGHGSPLDNHFCGKCGAPLQRQLPAPRADAPLALIGRSLPVSWRQLGTSVAVGAAALAAEAGLAWLLRRIDQGAPSRTGLARPSRALSQPAGDPASVVTIISQRVVDVVDGGDGHRRISERHVWRRIEE